MDPASLSTYHGKPLGPDARRAPSRCSGVPAPTSGNSSVALLFIAVAAGVACDDVEDQGAGADKSPPAWVTAAEHRFGDSAEGEFFFVRPTVHADPARGRVFTVDRPQHRVSVLKPDGTVLFHVGRKGEGPGDFTNIGLLHIEPDGAFAVHESRPNRYTRFTATGELVGTVVGPGGSASYQGLSIDVYWPADGSYLGTPLVPTALQAGWRGLAPVTRTPVVRVRELGDGKWGDPEPLLWLDLSNRMLEIPVPGDPETTYPIITSQPFADPDWVRFEPGLAVVMRLGNLPGSVELIEVDAQGDTTWHRRVGLGAPRRLTSAMVDDAVEEFVTAMGRDTVAWYRQGYRDGIYRPDYVPPAVGPPTLTGSGEVWIRTPELLDTLRVYYAVRRGDPTGPPRRVLLPESLWVTDATENHVWGVEFDEVDRAQIVGRRLVAPPG